MGRHTDTIEPQFSRLDVRPARAIVGLSTSGIDPAPVRRRSSIVVRGARVPRAVKDGDAAGPRNLSSK
jgi:hypothetical protein